MSSPMNFSSPMDAESSRFSPFSPFIETSYSSDNCDTAETPLTVHAERDTFSCHFEYDHDFIMPSEFENTTTYHEFGSNSMDDLYFPAGTISPPFPSSSSTGESSQRYLDPSLSSSMPASETASACTALDPTEIDPFDAAFAARNEERVTQAPLLVQTSFTEACRYSSRFPAGHLLNSNFVHTYDLGDELGSGGYGFVMTAFHRVEGREVAVKFIVKDKVSEYGWTEDEIFGKLPTEVMLLSLIEHENIVKCLDLFEDRFYFYLVCWHQAVGIRKLTQYYFLGTRAARISLEESKSYHACSGKLFTSTSSIPFSLGRFNGGLWAYHSSPIIECPSPRPQCTNSRKRRSASCIRRENYIYRGLSPKTAHPPASSILPASIARSLRMH